MTLTLSRDAGEGSTYFDDIRVVESEMDVVKKDEDGNVVGVEQDFENNAQGIYPFVIGSAEGVTDNRTHLSELHEPYTQAGWDVKKVDDVLDGEWSVKTNGLTQRNGIIYQTIPQNFRFEPGVKYTVSFDYQAGSEGTYALTVGAGEFAGGTELYPMAKAMGEDGHYSIDIVGDISGQTWFGIYSTSTAPDLQGTSGSEADFGGYKDFILDNLKIERVDEEFTMEELESLIQQAEEGYDRENYTAEDWKYIADALTDARAAADKGDDASAAEIRDAYYTLRAAMQYLDTVDPASNYSYDIPLDGVVLTTPSEELNGTFGASCGPKEFAIDGNPQTGWMTAYDGWNSLIAAGDGWIDMQYPEPHTVDGIRYMASVPSSYNYNAITDADYEIWVKTADAAADPNGEGFEAEGYQKVAEGTWQYDSSWKMIEFDAVENVTNIRLLLTRVSSHNYWALASEIRGMSKAENPVEDEPAEEISTAVLEYAIELAGGVNTDGVIDVVRENFENALQNAQDILAKVQSGDTSVTQSQVDNAWRNLIKAMQYMEFKEANKDDLAKVIALAEEMNGNLDKYLEDGKEAFTSALAEAKEVYEDPIATQEEVTSAWQNLLNAMANMMLKPDKGLLEDLVAQAEGLNEADYDAQSFAAMRTALAAAKEVLADENATEEEISTSVAALEDALAKLTASTDGSKDETGTGNGSQDQTGGTAGKNNSSSAGSTSSSKTTSGTNAVKTGDTANTLPIAATAAAAVFAAGAVMILKKKEEN